MALCDCGCGMETPIAKQTRPERGVVAGQSMRFVHGHNGRKGGVRERFTSKFIAGKKNECWLWTGAKTSGYGALQTGTHAKPAFTLAHRLAWEFSNGPIPDGLSVLHKCDNPGCVNPAHLFLGSMRDNMADMAQKGRADRSLAKSGLPLGVTATKGGRFYALAHLAGGRYRLGTFDTPEEAGAIVAEARSMYHESLRMLREEAANGS